MSIHNVSPEILTLRQIEKIITGNYALRLSDKSRKKINDCRKYLEGKLENSDGTYYGINTGFGALHNVKISPAQLKKIQENLLLSHACGCGDEVTSEIVRIMLLLKIHSLAMGHSGVTVELVERLIDFFNKGILPVVYELGSLGASGDLAPLAHLSLPLIGKGEVRFNGMKEPSIKILNKTGLKPLQLKSKEGLALLNGTQFMSAYGVWILLKAKRLSGWADFTGALSVDAFQAKTEPFDQLIHSVRPHHGQKITAERIRNMLSGSPLSQKRKSHVQDPYSFRCIPQVHGASLDAMEYAERILFTEINSVTDNPVIFPKEDQILSGGNFHGQPLAIAFDLLAIGLAELGNISERRTYQLLTGQRGLPHFLTQEPGINSGFMVPQYTAAALVSRNKQLCTPASVDSIVSSDGQEDHVSMGANSVLKCLEVAQNLERILGIELLTAAQALEFRRPEKSSKQVEHVVAFLRKEVPFSTEDTYLYPLMEKSVEFIRNFSPVDDLTGKTV